MFSNLVKKITIICPECKTSMTFNVDADNIEALYNAVSNLKCPRCTKELDYEAQHMINAVRTYNSAVLELQDAANLDYSILS